jgi:hypothetical protein
MVAANRNSASSIAGLGPATGVVAVTADDTTKIATGIRGLYVGSAGNVSVLMEDGTTGIFVAVPAGTIIPGRMARVNATNTTAGSFLGLL